MVPVFLDVAYKDSNGELQRVDTLPAVESKAFIYAQLADGIFCIKRILTGRDPHSGDFDLRGKTIETRITTISPDFCAFHPTTRVNRSTINEVMNILSETFG